MLKNIHSFIHSPLLHSSTPQAGAGFRATVCPSFFSLGIFFCLSSFLTAEGSAPTEWDVWRLQCVVLGKQCHRPSLAMLLFLRIPTSAFWTATLAAMKLNFIVQTQMGTVASRTPEGSIRPPVIWGKRSSGLAVWGRPLRAVPLPPADVKSCWGWTAGDWQWSLHAKEWCFCF